MIPRSIGAKFLVYSTTPVRNFAPTERDLSKIIGPHGVAVGDGIL
jgi:hypothetical protein